LASIVNRRRTNPAIDVTAFPNTPAGYSWSSSSYAGNSSSAWYVNFFTGSVSIVDKSSNYYVRCVRSGP